MRSSDISAGAALFSIARWVGTRGILAAIAAWVAAACAHAAAVDWRLLGDWTGGGQYAGFVVTFSPDGGYVIAQDGVPTGFGTYAVDGRQMLLFPGGMGEYPERGAYGFSGADRLFIMSPNFGRSEWQRVSGFDGTQSSREFEYGEQTDDDKSSFEKAVEKLEKLSSSLDGVERKLDGEAEDRAETATDGSKSKKRSLFDRMKDAARKTAGTAGNLTRKAGRSIKAAGDAWKREDETMETEKRAVAAESATPAEDEPPEVAPGINPMLGGATTTAVSPAGGPFGITTGTASRPMATATTFGAASTGVAVDVALAQRAAQVAGRWKPDASLVEIVARVSADGSADVSAPPQAVSLWFASPSAPGDGLMMSLAPDGSFVSAPASRAANDSAVPASFIAAGQAINVARTAGAEGESFSASLRPVNQAGFGWFIASATGGREIVIDAVTGQPLR